MRTIGAGHIKLLGILAFIAVPTAQAATLTVGAGQTFSTIQACANSAQPGDTCVVNTGAYDERVIVPRSGSQGNDIAFRANGSAKVKAFTLINRAYVTIDGFEITHQNFNAEAYPGTTDTASIYLRASHHLQILNNNIHDTEGSGILFYGAVPADASNYGTIRNNTIAHCGALSPSAHSGISIFGDANLAETNDISHNGEDFVLVTGGSFNVVRNNVFHDNSWADFPGSDAHIDGVQNWCTTGSLATRHLLIENNLLANAPDGHSHFIIFQDYGNCGNSEIIARYNTIRNIGSGFIVNDEKVTNIRIYNNTAVDLAVAYTPKDWTTAGAFDYSTGNKNINNIFYNVVRDGGNIYGHDSTSSQGFFADYNLGYNTLCTTSCSWSNPPEGISNEPHAILNKDPLFADYASGNLALQNTSPARDSGGPLTHVATADLRSGTSLVVDDAGYFQDGWAGVDKDWITIGRAGNSTQISSIDYAANTITLSQSLPRNPGDPVWLFKDSDGTQVLYGNAPDIGAHEVPSGDSTPPASPTGFVGK